MVAPPPGAPLRHGVRACAEAHFARRPLRPRPQDAVGTPDGLFARATAAGAEVVDGLKDEEYGSRGFSVRDPEGTIWAFGTYRGASS